MAFQISSCTYLCAMQGSSRRLEKLKYRLCKNSFMHVNGRGKFGDWITTHHESSQREDSRKRDEGRTQSYCSKFSLSCIYFKTVMRVFYHCLIRRTFSGRLKYYKAVTANLAEDVCIQNSTFPLPTITKNIYFHDSNTRMHAQDKTWEVLHHTHGGNLTLARVPHTQIAFAIFPVCNLLPPLHPREMGKKLIVRI